MLKFRHIKDPDVSPKGEERYSKEIVEMISDDGNKRDLCTFANPSEGKAFVAGIKFAQALAAQDSDDGIVGVIESVQKYVVENFR